MLPVKIEEPIESEDGIVLLCSGGLVDGEETALLCSAVGQHGRNITLDLSHVDAIDAAGIGALLSLQAAGIYLRLKNPVKAVREALRVTKLDSVFEIFYSSLVDASLAKSVEAEGDLRRRRFSPPSLSPLPVPAN